MKDIIFLTSVINISKVPFNYSKIRSFYTPEQRFQQTLNTIESIRTRFPSAEILIVECTNLSEEYYTALSSKVEYFTNVYEDEEMRKICLESEKKGYGEVIQTRHVLDYLQSRNINFKRLFKITGRYYLNENFREENFVLDKFTFKKQIETGNNDIVFSTVLYSVPFCLRDKFYESLCLAIESYKNGVGKGIEEVLPILCQPMHQIETTGASGLIGVTDDLIHA